MQKEYFFFFFFPPVNLDRSYILSHFFPTFVRERNKACLCLLKSAPEVISSLLILAGLLVISSTG